MAKPDSLIHIEIVPGGNRLKYRQQGGGTFRDLNTAQARIDSLTRSGVHFKVWTTGPIDWKEV